MRPFLGAHDRIVADDADVNILVLGDSTGESYNEWAGLFAQWLGTQYPTHTVEWEAYWNSGAEDWGDTRTVSTGTGSNTIKVWVAAGGGWGMAEATAAGAYDHPSAVDFIVSYIGINHSQTESVNVAEWETGLAALQAQWPAAYITVVAQHPVINPGYAAPGAWAASLQNAGARIVGPEWGLGFSDWETILLARDSAAIIDLDDFFEDGDGIHTNATGSAYIADHIAGLFLQGANVVSIAGKTPELLLQAKNYGGSGDWLDESGNGHNASISGATFLEKGNYSDSIWFPEVVGNNLQMTVSDWDWTVSTLVDNTLDDDLGFALRIRMDDYNDGGFMRLYSQQDLDWEMAYHEGLLESRFVLYGAGSSSKLSTAQLDAQPGVVNGEPVWVKAVYDLSEHEHLFYYSLDDTNIYSEVSWTQLGSAVASARSSGEIALGGASGKTMYVGQRGTSTNPWLGYLHRFVVLEGAAEKIVCEVRGEDMGSNAAATFTDNVAGATVTVNRTSTGYRTTFVDGNKFALSTNDYMEIADDAALDFAAGDPLTILAVCEPATIAAGQDVIVAKKDDLTTAAGWALVRNAATGQFIIADGTADDDDTAGTMTANTLYTLAGVRNVTDDDLEAFVDGSGSGSPTTDSTTATLANALPVRIGATSGTAANFWEGQIIAVALFADEFTDAEVLQVGAALTATGGRSWSHVASVGQELT